MRFSDASVLVETLAAHHDRAAFSCGNEALDRYLREQATQDIRRNTARIFVAVEPSQPDRMLGFFTLSAASVVTSDLPPEIARRLPRHPIPAALIGRLAVDRNVAGRGLGGVLVADAVKKALAAAETVATAVVIVDPIDEAVRQFYSGFGFRSMQGPQQRMFLSLRNSVLNSLH